MIPASSSQSSGIGQTPTHPFSPSGVAFLLSRFPKVSFQEIRAWANRHRSLDLGEMDLSQWPPRPVSLTVKPVGSPKDK
jgi:hypothetical protein